MRITVERTSAIIIDLQEKLLPHMCDNEGLLDRCRVLLSGLALLNVPVHVTEQYPEGLGETVPAISGLFTAEHPVSKRAFSCCDEPEIIAQLKELRRSTVLLAGIESHVCVLQTALDLKALGYDPVIVTDAVSSRREVDRHVALQRVVQEGCLLTTVESVLFELMRTSRHASFKEISRLVK